MSHHLITFLGGSSESDLSKRYRKTQYRFADRASPPLEYFGVALERELRPDRILILGTTGSMWDVLLEMFNLSSIHSVLYESLYMRVCSNQVTEDELAELQVVLQPKLQASITLALIPYGLGAKEQHRILEIMAYGIGRDDRVSMDITHGLRHLPALAQISALYIARVRQAKIVGMYYGAFELTQDGQTPVIDLSGLLDIADWVQAVAEFSGNGDYSVFGPLLTATHPQVAILLQDAAFEERNLRHTRAGKHLAKLPAQLDENPLQGAAELFEETLRERTGWYSGLGDYQQQRKLAITYLKNRDYMRCALYAFEAFITRLHQRSPGTRDDAKRFFEADTNSLSNPDWPDYQILRDIRNAIAHGEQGGRKKLTQRFRSEQSLKTELNRLLRKLLPESASS